MDTVGKEEIRKLAIESGFSDCGFTSLEPFSDYEEQVKARAADDLDGASRYFGMLHRARPADKRAWAKTIVVCIRRYGKYKLPEELVDHIGRNYLCDSRSDLCPDKSIDKKFVAGLRELGIRYKRGGLPDRAVAARAGVAKIGRNCFAYSRHGSWINIETWSLDAEVEPDKPTLDCPCVPGCTACIDACPTGALCAPYTTHMSKCAAYLSYESPEPVADDLWAKMGECVYGCDICQQVCPMNKGKWEELEDLPWIEAIRDKLTPEALAVMDEATYRDTVHPLFWYIKLDNLERWHKNARRALDAGRKPEA